MFNVQKSMPFQANPFWDERRRIPLSSCWHPLPPQVIENIQCVSFTQSDSVFIHHCKHKYSCTRKNDITLTLCPRQFKASGDIGMIRYWIECFQMFSITFYLIWMVFEGHFSVGFLDFVIVGSFGESKCFIIIFPHTEFLSTTGFWSQSNKHCMYFSWGCCRI